MPHCTEDSVFTFPPLTVNGHVYTYTAASARRTLCGTTWRLIQANGTTYDCWDDELDERLEVCLNGTRDFRVSAQNASQNGRTVIFSPGSDTTLMWLLVKSGHELLPCGDVDEATLEIWQGSEVAKRVSETSLKAPV